MRLSCKYCCQIVVIFTGSDLSFLIFTIPIELSNDADVALFCDYYSIVCAKAIVHTFAVLKGVSNKRRRFLFMSARPKKSQRSSYFIRGVTVTKTELHILLEG